jgi:alpha-D-ribose 1-methylphosphonate 5-triphosphate synthase subunit PhnH
VIGDRAEASFLFGTGWMPLDGLAAGTPEQPHRSATVVLDVSGAGAGGRQVRATGPGIDGYADLDVPWAPDDFLDQWQRNTARFPLGVDLLLVGPDHVRGLPRTTHLEGAA